MSSIYISSTQPRSGTLVVSIGLMEILKGHFKNVAYFRPIIDDNIVCENVEFMIEHFKLDMNYNEAIGYPKSKYIEAFSNEQKEIVLDGIIAKIEQLYQKFDIVLIEGYPKDNFYDLLDEDINMIIASALTSNFIPIINAKNKTKEELVQEYHMIKNLIEEHTIKHLCSFITRIDKHLNPINNDEIYYIQENPNLSTVSINDIINNSSIKAIKTPKGYRNRTIKHTMVASMNIKEYITSLQDSSLVITSSDRLDIVLSSMTLYHSSEHAYISAILLCGGSLQEQTINLIKHFHTSLVVLYTDHDIVSTLKELQNIQPSLHPHDQHKISIVKFMFDHANVNLDSILHNIAKDNTHLITPSMFRYQLIKKSQSNPQHIVLPESEDDRILIATREILQRGLAKITLLGNKADIHTKAKELHLDISKASVIDISKSHLVDKFAKQFYELRKHKGITKQQAYEVVCKPNYFGVMMINDNLADGMVCGAVYTTADTIRPALQIIGTQNDIDIVSSLFFMGLSSGVVVYADCAIVVDPNPQELATIAISTAKSAKAFGIEPRVAMLSYSSGNSGKGKDVQKIKEALEIVKQKEPNLIIDGPMQYDSAIDKEVASHKMPYSPVAGRANVFIFPDLNSGNNTYKAVQRNTYTTAIGPILQGLKKPINDLSRGCSVEDIINTVMVTSILAQQKEK